MILDLAESLVACLGRESARKLVKFQPDARVLKRWHELTLKEQQGRLSPEEQMEYLVFLHAQNFLAALQRKARSLLRRPKASS